MMAESPTYACKKAVVSALTNQGAWGNRVALNRASVGWDYPYVIIVDSGATEPNMVRAQGADANVVLVVKVVDDDLATASSADAAIAALLNDKGTQDVLTGYLEGGADWAILTSTREDFISMDEYVSDTKTLYHEGARYRFMMEAK